MSPFENPFRPGAGHPPPFLAGRDPCFDEFLRLLRQTVILENLVITGLRGVGKTVLFDQLQPKAVEMGWDWVGNDLSEQASISEQAIVTRLIADLSMLTSKFVVGHDSGLGFGASTTKTHLDYRALVEVYSTTPGLASDKIKAVLELTWKVIEPSTKGIVFAYDEAQNLADHAAEKQFPLSLLLDVFQSIQKKGIPFMLVLSGLPTLFPKLVEARTFAERMFHVMELDRLDESASREAITIPVKERGCPVRMSAESIDKIVEMTKGYPYFIQFVCREVYDVFRRGDHRVPTDAIMSKLDSDFFAGRWQRASERQQELMWAIAHTRSKGEDFTVREAVECSKEWLLKSIGSSHANQMLVTLSNQGLSYKTSRGRYAFAVPLLGDYILRRDAPAGAKTRDVNCDAEV